MNALPKKKFQIGLNFQKYKMEKNQIHFNQDQIKILEKLIEDSEISFEDLINDIRKKYFKKGTEENKSRKLITRKAKSIIGKYKSKEKDISNNHDKYLSEDFR